MKAENRWREVTASFIFPATATNASFMLKKYYMSLLYHFEQLYLFRVQGWYQQEIGLCYLRGFLLLLSLAGAISPNKYPIVSTDSRTYSSIEGKTEPHASNKRKRGINASPSG